MTGDWYRVAGRITKGAMCVVRGREMHPMRATDPPSVTDGLLLASEGMHPGDRCIIIGERVRRVREVKP